MQVGFHPRPFSSQPGCKLQQTWGWRVPSRKTSQGLMVPTPAQICMYHFLSFAPDGIRDHPLVKIILNVYLSIKNEYACVIKLRE